VLYSVEIPLQVHRAAYHLLAVLHFPKAFSATSFPLLSDVLVYLNVHAVHMTKQQVESTSMNCIVAKMKLEFIPPFPEIDPLSQWGP